LFVVKELVILKVAMIVLVMSVEIGEQTMMVIQYANLHGNSGIVEEYILAMMQWKIFERVEKKIVCVDQPSRGMVVV
jgi:hypothetical protein